MDSRSMIKIRLHFTSVVLSTLKPMAAIIHLAPAVDMLMKAQQKCRFLQCPIGLISCS
jgi:hypothetical protein